MSTYNLENLYDFRDDPTDGCDFARQHRVPGREPAVRLRAGAATPTTSDAWSTSPTQITDDLHSPDILLTQEAEDQDICHVAGAAGVRRARGRRRQARHPPGADAGDRRRRRRQLRRRAYDRDGADDRGIVSAFLYRRTGCPWCRRRPPTPCSGRRRRVVVPGAGPAGSNADVSNPKTLNAELPADVDRSTGMDGINVYTRAPQVAHFLVAARPGSADTFDLWAISNHFSSGPDGRVGQRTEQAAYAAAIADAIGAADPTPGSWWAATSTSSPGPDDPFAPGDPLFPSDQLGPLYDAGLANLWDDLVADVPGAAYSYTFQGQAQTLDQLFVNDPLHGDLVQVRAAHVNAGWPADFAGDGARGLSDHDPQVARFSSRASCR